MWRGGFSDGHMAGFWFESRKIGKLGDESRKIGNLGDENREVGR